MTAILLALALPGLLMLARPAATTVEDWVRHPLGASGIPAGWTAQPWGRPAYDLTIVEDGGRRALHMRSRGDRSTISKDVRGVVRLTETPVIAWSWKVVTLPAGGDARKRETTDHAAQLYVGWGRFPTSVRSRIIGYVWDTTAPAGLVARSRKTGAVTYVIVRSGASDLGRWLHEERDVRADYRAIFGEDPDEPTFLSLSIDSNDSASSAESYIGPISFRPRAD